MFIKDTLAEAQALLVGLESPDPPDDSMDVDEEVADKMPSSSEDSPDDGSSSMINDCSTMENECEQSSDQVSKKIACEDSVAIDPDVLTMKRRAKKNYKKQLFMY